MKADSLETVMSSVEVDVYVDVDVEPVLQPMIPAPDRSQQHSVLDSSARRDYFRPSWKNDKA